MRDIGITLWQILQEIDTNFLEENAALKNTRQLGKIILSIRCNRFRDEQRGYEVGNVFFNFP